MSKSFLASSVPHIQSNILQILVSLVKTTFLVAFNLKCFHFEVPSEGGLRTIVVNESVIDETLDDRSLTYHGVSNKDNFILLGRYCASFYFARTWLH